jgi:hypothetical protein
MFCRIVGHSQSLRRELRPQFALDTLGHTHVSSSYPA